MPPLPVIRNCRRVPSFRCRGQPYPVFREDYGGNNVLYGDDGKDMLAGSLGNDQFQFDTALGSSNVDTITNFCKLSGDNDTIRLSKAVFAILATGGLPADEFAGNATAKANDGDDHILYNTGIGALFCDADGNGVGDAIQFAVLTGHPPLAAADFLVV